MILVDSDVITAHLRGHQATKDWLRTARHRTGRLALSVVSVFEVAGGQHELLGWNLGRSVIDFMNAKRATLDVDEYG